MSQLTVAAFMYPPPMLFKLSPRIDGVTLRANWHPSLEHLD